MIRDADRIASVVQACLISSEMSKQVRNIGCPDSSVFPFIDFLNIFRVKTQIFNWVSLYLFTAFQYLVL